MILDLEHYLVKEYLRIDFEDDDILIGLIIEASKEYIENMVGYIDLSRASFKILLCAICGELYSRRSYLIDKQLHRNKTISSLILQLQLKEEEKKDG